MNEATRQEQNSQTTKAARERAKDPRVARGLEALNLWAKREGWTRSKKRRALEAFHIGVKLAWDAEAAGR